MPIKSYPDYPFELSTFTEDGRLTIPRSLMLQVEWLHEKATAKEPVEVRLVVAQRDRIRIVPPNVSESAEEAESQHPPDSGRDSPLDRKGKIPVRADAAYLRSARELMTQLKFSGVSYRLQLPRIFQIPLETWKTSRKLGVVLVDGTLEIWSGVRIGDYYDVDI